MTKIIPKKMRSTFGPSFLYQLEQSIAIKINRMPHLYYSSIPRFKPFCISVIRLPVQTRNFVECEAVPYLGTWRLGGEYTAQKSAKPATEEQSTPAKQ